MSSTQEGKGSQASVGGRVAAPKHLWVVGGIALLWNAMGCFDYLMTELRSEEYLSAYTEEQLDYFYSFPSWMIALWAVAVWGGLVGSVLLLLRKRAAMPVLAVSLACMVVTAINNYMFGDAMEMLGTFAAVFTVVIFAIALGLVVYARAMTARGVLR